MTRKAHMQRLKRDQRGATVVEFAIVLPVLCIALLGLCDLGYSLYVKTVTHGVLEAGARKASVGTLTKTQLQDYIKTQIANVDSQYGTTSIVTRSYYNFSRIGKPEKITTDTNPIGTYNSGDCYEDANNNGTFDANGGSDTLGGADDVVHYQISVSFPRLFPMNKLLGWSNTENISSQIVFRNQPWAAQNRPVIKC